MTTQGQNHFQDLIEEIQATPPNQRLDKAFSGIANQMQQSGVQAVQQWGGELNQVKSQLVRACLSQQSA